MTSTVILITNRNFLSNDRFLTPQQLGDTFNNTPGKKGPLELRILIATGVAVDEKFEWKLELLPDVIDKISWLYANIGPAPDDPPANAPPTRLASEFAARKTIKRAAESKRQILFFVHGYNNDVQDALDSCGRLETQYEVIPILFTWPSNGGDAIIGTMSYLSDKDDAAISAKALERALAKAIDYLALLRTAKCNVKINALFHSMGNYVLEQALADPTLIPRDDPLFDNVLLVAADTNNKGHELWVNKIVVRNRVYIVINEDDLALGASRAKLGDKQLARLGHFVQNLTAEQALYINLTGAVGDAHSYYVNAHDPRVRNLFLDAVNGKILERNKDDRYTLDYHARGFFVLK